MYNPETRRFEKHLDYNEQDICQMYNDGYSSTFISTKHNISASLICGILHKNKVTIRKFTQLELSTNYNFLSYFYGVLLGDGHLVKNPKSNQIVISSSDFDHLEKIKTFINHGKISKVGKNAYTFAFTSLNYMNWALELGCVRGNKSSLISLPSNLNTSLVILGLMDTDGCWYKDPKGKRTFTATYFTVSETMILSIADYLNTINIKHTINIRINKKSTHKDLYSVYILSNSIRAFINHIYKDAFDIPFLDRKFKKVESLTDSTFLFKLQSSS